MTTLTANQFKSTNIRGTFTNTDSPDSTPILASGSFQRGLFVGADLSCNGIIYNTDLASQLAAKASTTYVDTSIANLVSSAPSTLDTLNELATALGDDPNFATTITTNLGNKASTSALTATNVIVTSNTASIVTLNSTKQNTISSSNYLNANLIGTGAISNSVFNYLSGVSSNIQIQLNTISASVGPQGAQGSQGYQGLIGSQGSQGYQGNQGYQGTVGSQGNQGSQGAVGSQGNQGNQGIVGSQGNQGNQGAVGSQGNQGYQGAVGSQGNQGNQGTVGSQGNQGYQGTVGSQGSQGSQGNQGTTPSTSTFPQFTTNNNMTGNNTFGTNGNGLTQYLWAKNFLMLSQTGAGSTCVPSSIDHSYNIGAIGGNYLYQNEIDFWNMESDPVNYRGWSFMNSDGYGSSTAECVSIYKNGNVTIAGTITSPTITSINSAVALNAPINNASLTGSTSVASLSVSGTSSFTGSVTIAGTITSPTITSINSAVALNAPINNASLTGSTTIASLSVSGTSSFTGSATHNGTLTLNAGTTVNASITSNSTIITPTSLSYISGASSNLQTQLNSIVSSISSLASSLSGYAALASSNTFTAINYFNNNTSFKTIFTTSSNNINHIVTPQTMSSDTTFTAATISSVIISYNANPTLPDASTMAYGFEVMIKAYYNNHGYSVSTVVSNGLLINGTPTNSLSVGNGLFTRWIALGPYWLNVG